MVHWKQESWQIHEWASPRHKRVLWVCTSSMCHQLATRSTAAGLVNLSRPETVQSLYFLHQATRDYQCNDLTTSAEWNWEPTSTCACVLIASCTAYCNDCQRSLFKHVLCYMLLHFLVSDCSMQCHKLNGDRSGNFCAVPASDCNESRLAGCTSFALNYCKLAM